MSSLSNRTQDIDIRNPELWTLVIRLDETSLKFILYCEEEENSLISRELHLDDKAGDYLKALENCVYDNPVLIQDYKQVAVSVHSSRFVILPAEAGDEDTMLDIMDYMYADDNCDSVQCDLEGGKTSVAFSVPRGVVAFLQRTFNMPKIVHSLVPLCLYSAKKSEKSGITKMYAHVCNDCLDVCVFRKGELMLANTFKLRDVEEASFYLLNVWQSLGLDVMTDELQLSADKSVRDVLTPQLRKYITYVMPIIFPASAVKIGQDAMKAPFDLILLSQCVL